MGTPFITLLEPSNLESYSPGVPHTAQPASVPKAFLDAMSVREDVFVGEQGVPLANEFDADDARSCHWVVYASVSTVVEDEGAGEGEGRRRSETRSLPVGTIRLVPFPHAPHPTPGGVYEAAGGGDMVLVGIKREDDGEVIPVEKGGGGGGGGGPGEADRATSLHDGKESYVKLGRLAVLKDFRGHRLGKLLVGAALSWMSEHASYFDPSLTAGLDQLGIDRTQDIPKFNGLVCAHAQESVVGAWQKLGFEVDEGMGKWWEEGIPHVGMFQRLALGPEKIDIR